MLSKTKAKFVISLQRKKIREEEKQYVVEGDKIVREYLFAGMPVDRLYAKPEFIKSLPEELIKNIRDIEPVSFEELKQISSLTTPHNALAVVKATDDDLNTSDISGTLVAALDFIQDPGNMGTIIRAAAWFGITNIVCSENCVDKYNPKVIQASMGAILNVNVHYLDLKGFLEKSCAEDHPVYGTMLEGNSVYEHPLSRRGVIVIGNESRGISKELMPYINEKIMIPKSGEGRFGIDSLNAGMAASVIFSEFARRKV